MCEEQTVSLVDVVEEDEELEEEASAVLAGSDSDHCSYPQGYVKRQALYACSSCSPPGGEAAGVCLACSYTCHEGHDLFELYTKRNFRCDCGNNKFSDRRCKLFPDKDEFNTLNKYSQNFFGVYCTCSRPYPDPEDQVEDEMIQCVACEDWLHGRHLGCLVPDSVESHEMICDSCMNKNPFLWTYAAHLAVSGAAAQVKEEPGVDESNKEETGDDVTEPSRQGDDVTEPSRQGDDITEPSRQGDDVTEPSRQGDDVTEPSRQGDDITEPSCKRSRDDATSSCRLKELEGIEKKTVQSGAVFWPSGWRSKLCSCNTCKDSLSHCSLSFLLDDSDTVLAYENKGKSNEQRRQGHDPLMSALHQLTRVQQLEIIHGYNDMKTELKDFLQRFAAEGKVVTPDDIRQFFENQSQKRRRDEAARFRPT